MFDVDRREFIRLLGCAAAGFVAPANRATAQQSRKVPRVGILTPAQNGATPIFEAFRRALRDLGYLDGKNIILDFRFAKGSLDALPALAAELVRIPVDVIVADTSNAARAALDATHTIPIVLGG
jgi:putative ABC transport system substrate-binding protein